MINPSRWVKLRSIEYRAEDAVLWGEGLRRMGRKKVEKERRERELKEE